MATTFDRTDDPARIRRHHHYGAGTKTVGQVAREVLCDLLGHRPRERKPTFLGQQWLFYVCGRCGRYPIRRTVEP